jgi:DNA-directed RNA polymerase subunit RPC12/RpoP
VKVHELTCPVCQADVPLSGDERPGSEVYCTYCGAPCLMKGDPNNPEDWDLEEDF